VTAVKGRRGRLKRVWGVPILLAMLGLAGLVLALVGDGVLDTLSYLSLAVPLVVILWAVARRTR
jgi:hypothetical protein